jgi:hypothetical protein
MEPAIAIEARTSGEVRSRERVDVVLQRLGRRMEDDGFFWCIFN